MKKVVLVLSFLFAFTNLSTAAFVGDFGPPGTVQLYNSELFLHFGTDDIEGSFNLADPDFDINTSYPFRLDWEAAGTINGSILFNGSLQKFFDRDVSMLEAATLVVNGQPTTFTSFAIENGNGYNFIYTSLNGMIEPAVNLTKAEISTVPIPAGAWLLATGLVGLAALKRKNKK